MIPYERDRRANRKAALRSSLSLIQEGDGYAEDQLERVFSMSPENSNPTNRSVWKNSRNFESVQNSNVAVLLEAMDLTVLANILKVEREHQFRRYVELSMDGLLTPFWVDYGQRHWSQLAPFIDSIRREILVEKAKDLS